MDHLDEAAAENQRLWDAEVKQGCGYTVPWLDLDPAQLRAYARGELDVLPEPLTCLYPHDVFTGVRDKHVLCLAAGGGQQSAAFGVLGARVTVVDLTAGQLAGDRKAAAHYGYRVTTFQSDMRDLSDLRDGTVDLVYQANSLAYIPDVRPLYGEVSRVLRPGGRYRVCAGQPAVHAVVWNGDAYCITHPYSERVFPRPDGVGIEFRHTMAALFNGLLDAGLTIQRVHEAPYAFRRDEGCAPPGSWDHERAYVAGEFVIVAEKRPRRVPVMHCFRR
jgi:SAM-dependent methyltransferase